jgi:hypothetical protein
MSPPIAHALSVCQAHIQGRAKEGTGCDGHREDVGHEKGLNGKDEREDMQGKGKEME